MQEKKKKRATFQWFALLRLSEKNLGCLPANVVFALKIRYADGVPGPHRCVGRQPAWTTGDWHAAGNAAGSRLASAHDQAGLAVMSASAHSSA